LEELLLKGGADFIQAQGTMTFIKNKTKCLGVINGPVVHNKENPDIHIKIRRPPFYHH